jgi:hypothetical protein
MITLGAIVHLGACSFVLYGDEGYLAKERIRLGIGALKTLEECWTVAGCVLQQVKGVAREVFALPKPKERDEKVNGFITEDEIMKYIDEEQPFESLGETDYYGLPALEWDGTDGLEGLPSFQQ